MAAERVPMRKLREVIRLRLACGLSGRAIAQSCRLSVSTVSGYLGRVAVAKLGWPLPAQLDDDTALERPMRATPPARGRSRTGRRSIGSFAAHT